MARRRSKPRQLRGQATPRKADVTRESILDAAAATFRTRGYSGARLRDIAARIGMKAGSLYYHFESRDTLVEAVMALGVGRTHEAVLGRLRSLPAEANPLDRLRAARGRADDTPLVLAAPFAAAAFVALAAAFVVADGFGIAGAAGGRLARPRTT